MGLKKWCIKIAESKRSNVMEMRCFRSMYGATCVNQVRDGVRRSVLVSHRTDQGALQ